MQGRILSFEDELSGDSIKKPTPIKILKLLALKTTMDIPIIFSNIIEVQRLNLDGE